MDINNTLLHVNPRPKKKTLLLGSKQGTWDKYHTIPFMTDRTDPFSPGTNLCI